MRRVFAAAFVLAAIGLFVLGASERVEAGGTHIVQQGETLYRIALRYGITVGALAAYNGLSDPTRIHPGQVLKIPEPGTRERGNETAEICHETNSPTGGSGSGGHEEGDLPVHRQPWGYAVLDCPAIWNHRSNP